MNDGRQTEIDTSSGRLNGHGTAMTSRDGSAIAAISARIVELSSDDLRALEALSEQYIRDIISDARHSKDPLPSSFSSSSELVTMDHLCVGDLSDESKLQVPVLPGFECREVLGVGGMGVVYRAYDQRLDREVALKTVRPELASSPRVERRFQREMRIAAQLQHPCIPAVYCYGSLQDGRPYLAMKLIRGQTLSQLLKERSNAIADLTWFVQIFKQVCHAVGYAHTQGVAHRDLKPQNVMVGAFGEVQVMDWGLAKKVGNLEPADRVDGASATSAVSVPLAEYGDEGFSGTRFGTACGTLMYMPPEQVDGEPSAVEPRSDVFALGAILCQILTGVTLYTGTYTQVRTCARAWLVEDAFVRLDGCGADLELIDLCKLCLSKRPADRPADGGTVAMLVTNYATRVEIRRRSAELARATAEAQAVAQRSQARWQLGLVASLATFLLAVGTAAWQYDSRRTDDQRRHARNQDALNAWVGRCEAALSAEDAAAAEVAMTEVERRLPDGAGEAIQVRLDQCRIDFALLRDLDRIDDLRWSLVDGRRPSKKRLAMEWAEALQRYGIVLGVTSPQEAARKVTGSLLKERL
ncbi:MAG TPA: serine/threonine-protein kinase, partial [Gemmataceae bacterium]|nr:serine/threonine-protein kinase [Gemmataceae bacterium]